MKTIITGGAGFLGSHLCDFLFDKGHKVIYIGNLVDGIYRLIMSDFVESVNIGNPDKMSVVGWETVGYFEKSYMRMS